MVLQTEFEFTLPRGYVDKEGNLHKKGHMRLATAADEILPMKDPRVQSNPAYLTVIVLSRAITKIGELTDITPAVIENLFIEDLSFLQEFYRRINGEGHVMVEVKCPKCGEQFQESMSPLGNNRLPLEKIREEVAFIAYYFHWDHDEIMNMPHKERQAWCEEISRINENMNQESRSKPLI